MIRKPGISFDCSKQISYTTGLMGLKNQTEYDSEEYRITI